MITPIVHNCGVSEAICLFFSEAMCPSTPNENEEIRNAPYLNAIRSSMYAMLFTTSHISQAVRSLSRYSSNLDKGHWKCIK